MATYVQQVGWVGTTVVGMVEECLCWQGLGAEQQGSVEWAVAERAVVGRAVVGRPVVGMAVVGRAVVGMAVVGRVVVVRAVVGWAVVGMEVEIESSTPAYKADLAPLAIYLESLKAACVCWMEALPACYQWCHASQSTVSVRAYTADTDWYAAKQTAHSVAWLMVQCNQFRSGLQYPS